jgi:ABC-type nitrate/sulfonate/bicarbonate transport system substrate-binding protein
LPNRIKIGLINDSVNMLDHFVALDLGLYKDEGLDVELVQQPNFGSLTGLDSGEILLTSATPRVVQSILLKDARYKFVLITRKNPPHYIVSRPEIRDVAGLRNKTIWSSGPGSGNYYMTLDWLRENGLQPGIDVHVRHFGEDQTSFFSKAAPPSWIRGFMKMAFDGLMCVPPEREWMVELGGYHSLVDLCQRYPDRMIHGLATSEDTLKKMPDLVRSVVRAHCRASETIRTDREVTVSCIAKRWNLIDRVAEGVWATVKDCFIASTDSIWLEALFANHKRHLEETHPETRVTLPNIRELLDGSFVP